MLYRYSRATALALAFGASFALTTPAQADEATADTVIATVNGTEITLGHMILLRAALPSQYAQLPDDVLFQGILDQLIQQTALEQSYDGDTPRRVELALQNERRSLIASEVVGDVLAAAVTEAAIEAAYNDVYGQAAPEKEFNAAHILVETEDEAKALVDELNNGADFAALARENSTGPSGPNGGDLGWFGAGMMVKPFEQAVMDLEAGTVSEPVKTQFGWHVILLKETRLKEAPSLDEVRDEMRTKVEQDVVTGHIDELVKASDVDRSGVEGFDTSLISKTELLE
jgi:peptidyl-prolyl cis-trans isomerase C